MSLVGDIIMELRQRIPDAPAVSNSPFILAISSTSQPGGEFQPGSTQSVGATSFNQWGETAVDAAAVVTITLGPSDNTLIVTVQSASSSFLGNNLYLAGNYIAPNVAMLYGKVGPLPMVTNTNTYVLGAPPFPGGATSILSNPPLRNTAYHPDTDGNFIGAYTAYRLLNRALQEMVRIAGGIIDVTGVQSQINQSMYRLASPFYQFINAWFDGYPMDIVPRNFMYLRNSAAGFSGIMSYEQDGPQSVIQVWPQSNRTGGQNQLAGDIDADTNSFYLFAGASNFLSIGLAQIDDEVVAYSKVTPASTGPPPFNNLLQFSGVTRGMGGTDAVAHNANAPVTELNIRMSGYRMARTYNVGDSALTIQVPQAWETPLVLHMLSQVRSMEQDDAAAEKLMTDFVQMAEKIARTARIGKTKPRQIPIWGQNTSDARNVTGTGFGWLIN